MSNLPRIAELEFVPAEVAESMETQTVHKTFAFDFNEGDFILKDGKMVEESGMEYLKTWIKKALRTVKDSSYYAGVNYGSDHHSLIGQVYKPAFSRAEYERLIREALLVNDAITRVENFTFSQTGSRLTISFDVISIFGQTNEAVMV